MDILVKWRQHRLYISILTLLLLLFSISNSEAFPYKGFDISLSATLSQIYDSNINFDDDSETDGYKVDGKVSLRLRRLGRRGYFGITGGVRRGIYYNLSEVDSGSESLALNFLHDFSTNLSIRMDDVYYHSTEPYDFGEEFYREKGRYDLHRNKFKLSLKKDVTKNFFINTFYAHTNIWRDVSSLDDYSSDTIGLGLNYKHGVDEIYYLSYNISEANRENSNDTTHHQIRAGIEKFLTFRTSMRGYVAFGYTDTDTGQEDTTNAISVSLITNINRVTNAGLDLYWGNLLFNEDDVFQKNWRISGHLDRNISNKSNGHVNFFYGKYNTDAPDGTNDFIGFGGNIDYQFSSRLVGSLGLSYSRSRLEEGGGYSRKSASLGVTYTY